MITFIQIIITFAVVFATMYWILNLSLEVSLLFGALATATAPAATLAVVREYRAKGSFTSTLLGVVALDDAVCIILFGIVSAVVDSLISGNGIGTNSIVHLLWR